MSKHKYKLLKRVYSDRHYYTSYKNNTLGAYRECVLNIVTDSSGKLYMQEVVIRFDYVFIDKLTGELSQNMQEKRTASVKGYYENGQFHFLSAFMVMENNRRKLLPGIKRINDDGTWIEVNGDRKNKSSFRRIPEYYKRFIDAARVEEAMRLIMGNDVVFANS